VFISGGLAFEKGSKLTNVQLTSGMADLMPINVGAEDVTMFFGANGPCWTDLNGNKTLDDGETNPDAVGFAITNANLAMSLLKPEDRQRQQVPGPACDSRPGGIVGIDAFQLEVTKRCRGPEPRAGGGYRQHDGRRQFCEHVPRR
jgi:hypothetical protein